MLITFFKTQQARTKEEKNLSLDEFGKLIRNTSARSKEKLPWFKAARFGDRASKAGCLRNDKNLDAITGIELDYDAGIVSFDEAVVTARKNRLECLLYTTPSHTPDKPKWRLVVECENEVAPSERLGMCNAINDLYGGIFSPESRVASQSYYFGCVEGREDFLDIVVVHGRRYADHFTENPFAMIAKFQVSTASEAIERLKHMRYKSGDETGVHNTQLSVIASLLNAGWELAKVTETVLEGTRQAVGSRPWNWEKEERSIRKMGEDWLDKADNVVGMPERERKIKKGISHIVIASEVLKVMWSRGEDILRVDGMWWSCNDGLWSSHDEKSFNDVIEKTIRASCVELKLVPTIKIVSESKSELRSKVTEVVEWDAHGMLATKSGLVNEGGELIPIRSDHYVTHRATVEFDPKACCPMWDQAMLDWFDDEDVRGLIQEIAGASLFLDKPKSLTRALILYGPSNTGKTTIAEVLSKLVSDQFIRSSLDEIDGSHGLMPFIQDRPWFIDEAFDAGKWHVSAKAKQLLSGDGISINVKNGPMISRNYRGPVFWSTNYPPQFKEVTSAITNRIVVVSCDRVFDPDEPTEIVTRSWKEGYARLSDFLIDKEGSGILNWELEGWKRAKARGYFVLPQATKDALEEVRADSNVALAFLNDCCTIVPDGFVARQDVYGAFSSWWEENQADNPPSPKTFWMSLRALKMKDVSADHKDTRWIGKHKERVCVGVHLNGLGTDHWTSWASSSRVQNSSARSVSAKPDDVNRTIGTEGPLIGTKGPK